MEVGVLEGNAKRVIALDQVVADSSSLTLNACSMPRGTIADGGILLAESAIADFSAADRIRMLCSRIERSFLGREIQPQVFAVTSAVPGEGKSVIAVNLARALGLDPRGKTLLIDCDLRKPNAHYFWKQENGPGLSDVITTGRALRAVIRSVDAGVDLLTAGSAVFDSAAVLEQPAMEMLISELKKYYRCILFDCPPLLLCSETFSLVELADCALMVVRAWRTEKKLVKDAVNVLDRKKLLGIVMNDCSGVLEQYGYYEYDRKT